ncbi:MAG: pilus assembly protein PilM, partial [Nitrosopumilaceae archaeon]|nr:pilus assembly protein PilM [Nitrosopumilaceae archaeon]
MLLGKGKYGVLGIDIGSNSIKIVELQEVGSNYRLRNIGEAPMIQGWIRNKSIVDSDAISQT